MIKIKKHKCFITDCITQIDQSNLMCNKHWRMVPDEMQLKVIKAFAGVQKGDKVSRGKYIIAKNNARLWVERENSIG